MVALLVCLIPTTIGALLAAIGIAGMDRALQANIIAKSGKAVETAGDIDVVLLDKTGTITVGNRHATEFMPVGRYSAETWRGWRRWLRRPMRLPRARASSSHAQATGSSCEASNAPGGAKFVAFTAQTRMSGIDLADGGCIRKGAPDAVIRFVGKREGIVPTELRRIVDAVASKGATPLVVAERSADCRRGGA